MWSAAWPGWETRETPPGWPGHITQCCRGMFALEYSIRAENPGAHLQFLRQTRMEQTLAYIREALGDHNFEVLSRAGAKLSDDEAVDLALRVIPT